jgi:hypothetical protein
MKDPLAINVSKTPALKPICPIMKFLLRTTTALFAAAAFSVAAENEEGFKPLFDGKSLDGWKVSENKDSFKIEEGAIVADGPRAHAFYVGEVGGAKFRNFELRLEAMTRKNSNGGVFFHTEYQEKGWPANGYEIQVNNTQRDPKKTGGLYSVVDNMEPFEDDKWMEMTIRVENGKITSAVDGKKLVEHTPEEGKSKLLPEGGAIALQAHDPGSKVYYRNIRIKILD